MFDAVEAHSEQVGGLALFTLRPAASSIYLSRSSGLVASVHSAHWFTIAPRRCKDNEGDDVARTRLFVVAPRYIRLSEGERRAGVSNRRVRRADLRVLLAVL